MPAEPPWKVDPDRTLEATLGFEVLDTSPDGARACFPVEDRVKQGFGLVHGGVFAALAETLCSVATLAAVWNDGMMAQGLSNNTSFLRPVLEGTVHAEARAKHRGRTTWVWEVEITDDEGRLCALSRMTVAVRPQPDQAR